MKNIYQYSISPIKSFMFLANFLMLLLVIAMEKFYWGNSLFIDEWPVFSNRYLIRSFIIFIAIAGMAWSLTAHKKLKVILGLNNWLEKSSTILVLLFAVISLILFMGSPEIFSDLSEEDKLIENASAIFLFASSFILLFGLLRYNFEMKYSKLIKISLGLLSFIFFVIGMEEVSWFQRTLGIETPEVFEGNYQNEMNLHNFATGAVENLYYFGAFIFFVVFSFFRVLFPWIDKNDYLKFFIARPFIALVGSISCAYNFDMWNNMFMQITFFASIVILAVFAFYSKIKIDFYVILTTISVLIISQFLFLTNGENFDRLWEITEYKEFYIAFAFFIYSCDVFFQVKKELSDQNKPVLERLNEV